MSTVSPVAGGAAWSRTAKEAADSAAIDSPMTFTFMTCLSLAVSAGRLTNLMRGVERGTVSRRMPRLDDLIRSERAQSLLQPATHRSVVGQHAARPGQRHRFVGCEAERRPQRLGHRRQFVGGRIVDRD